MQFQKEAVYIGHKFMKMRDGSELCSITFYVDDDAITVNVLVTNDAVMFPLRALSFGDKCTATFTLRKADKFYRLSLSALA